MIRLPYELRLAHDQRGNADHLLAPEDKHKIEEGHWLRAGGDALCTCGRDYYSHPNVIGALWLRRLCDDTFVKL